MILREIDFDWPGRQVINLLHWIPKWSFNYIRNAQPFPYQSLLDTIGSQYDTVETAQSLLAHGKDGNRHHRF